VSPLMSGLQSLAGKIETEINFYDSYPY